MGKDDCGVETVQMTLDKVYRNLFKPKNFGYLKKSKRVGLLGKHIFYIAVILLIFLVSGVVSADIECNDLNDPDCVVCANPYVEENFQNGHMYICNPSHPTVKTAAEDACCPTVADGYSSSAGWPNNISDCLANYVHNNNTAQLDTCGCCYNSKASGDKCTVDTDVTCGFTGGDQWEIGFTSYGSNWVSSCQRESADGSKVWWYPDCDEDGIVCEDYGNSREECPCVWCPDSDPETPTCMKDCEDCDGLHKINVSGDICISETVDPCDTDNYGICMGRTGCKWCPDSAGDTSNGDCVESCSDGECPLFPQSPDADGICTGFACGGLNLTECYQVSECVWCEEDLSGNPSCVGSCSGQCTLTGTLYPDCVDTCNDLEDNDGNGLVDEDDFCCRYDDQENNPLPHDENLLCLPECSEYVPDSDNITIGTQQYCRCGENGTTLSGPNQYCCGGTRLQPGPCQAGNLTVHLNPNVALANGFDGDNSVDIDGNIDDSISYVWNDTTDQDLKVLNIHYPQTLSFEMLLQTSSGNPEFVKTYAVVDVDASDITNGITIDVFTKNTTCYSEYMNENNIEFNISPVRCNYSNFELNWDIFSNKAGYTDVSCLEYVESVTVIDQGGNPVEYLAPGNTGTMIMETSQDPDDDPDYSIRLEMKCFGDDTQCTMDYDLDGPSETAASGDGNCTPGAYCDPTDDDKTFCLTGYNSWVYCDENNVLQVTSCEGDDHCGQDMNNNAVCLPNSSCVNFNFDTINFFGMYYEYDNTGESCTRNSSGSKFCYMDRSRTVVDTCNHCTDQTFCYEYDTKSACLAHNCNRTLENTTECKWMPTPSFGDIGEGYCYTAGYDGTESSDFDPDGVEYCDQCQNSQTTAYLFKNMECTEEVCDVLGNCYSDGGSNCVPCEEETTCYDFGEIECRRSDGDHETVGTYQNFGINDMCMDPNLICGESDDFEESWDACSLGKCRWTGTECIKDGDSDTNDDCSTGDTDCQRDVYPTRSYIKKSESPDIITQSSGNITIGFKRDQYTDSESLYYCMGSSNCIPEEPAAGNQIPATYDGGYLALWSLEDIEGTADIRFFTEDEHNNVEPIKNDSLPIDTRAPDIHFQTETHEYVDGYRMDMNLTSHEAIQQCHICLIESPLADLQDTEDCSSANVELARNLYSPDMEFDGKGYSDGNFTLAFPYSVSDYIRQGTWTLLVNCRDRYGNQYLNRTEINFKVRGEIYGTEPQGRVFGPEMDDDFNVSFNVVDEYRYCFYRNAISNNWVKFEDTSQYFVQVGRDYSYSRSIDGVHTDGYYHSDIKCNNNSNPTCNDPANDCDPVFEAVSYGWDETSPETSLYFLRDGTEYPYDPTRSIDSTKLVLRCDDNPNGVDYNGTGPFGCSDFQYCNATEDNTCTPSGWQPYDATGKGEISLSGLAGDNELCFRSRDVGHNNETLRCVDLVVDNNAPNLRIDVPQDGHIYGPSDFVSSSEPLEGIWRDDASREVEVMVNWDNGTDINYTYWVMYPLAGGFVQDISDPPYYVEGDYNPQGLDEIYPGTNEVTFRVRDSDSVYQGDMDNHESEVSMELIWDRSGPDDAQIVRIENDEGTWLCRSSGCRDEISEYGTNITFNFTVSDEYSENISEVWMELECVDGYCADLSGQLTTMHKFWLDENANGGRAQSGNLCDKFRCFGEFRPFPGNI